MYYELLDTSFTLVNDMLDSIPCCLATDRRIKDIEKVSYFIPLSGILFLLKSTYTYKALFYYSIAQSPI